MERFTLASSQQQPKFYRHFQAVFSYCLTLLLAYLVLLKSAYALDPVPASGYETFKGQPFFLLSDSSFGSSQIAQVRVEAPGEGFRDYLEQYGGVDIALYRVPKPLDFLKTQKNLHRLQLQGNYVGEGLPNTLNFLWDTWYKKSRRSWQRVFSTDVRTKAMEALPQLKTGQYINNPTKFENNPQYRVLPGFELTNHFRYPIWQAKQIAPPKGLTLEGSSSEFIRPNSGNVFVPLGKLKPGLYVVEAYIGAYRANTLLFVSDAIGVTKNAGQQMLVWTSNRQTGAPMPNSTVVWTDGAGVLASSTTDKDGVAELKKASPEHTYVLGQDAAGGVFVSENFYYDSEIYNTKVYAVTDRPLYRPGDTVNLKLMARKFISANQSTLAVSANIHIELNDPNGTPVAVKDLKFDAKQGGNTSFTLPVNAAAGGYELRMTMGDDIYSAAFRVADYIKPHFDMHLQMAKPSYKTGEQIDGYIHLAYPDGKPVLGAHLTLNVRAQASTMVAGDLGYSGQFPIKLEQQELVSDSEGNIKISLPAAKEPSRYILTMLASDDAAYRVKMTKELLIERGVSQYSLVGTKNFSSPNELVVFSMTELTSKGAAPATWEALRLESRTIKSGKITMPAKGAFSLRFAEAGSYTITIRDKDGNVLGATSHWVAGDQLQVVPGSVEIVFDKETYQPGQTAEALITFPNAVNNALLTLERDQVEHHALLAGSDLIKMQKLNAKQWKALIKVDPQFAPNITFSVLYVQSGEVVFQNAGIKVSQPTIDVAIKTDKTTYRPGEIVNVDIATTIKGQPVSSNVMFGAVDEMVYVLQPEIAPNIFDFFYHPRRNNVRTTSSLSFINYDLATAPFQERQKNAQNYNERSVKVLERPRRDEKDTASWQPALRTDASGHVKFSFVMPDSLTRWRMTARAMSDDGVVGQQLQYILSDKPIFVKLSGTNSFRQDDKPVLSWIVFNQTSKQTNANLQFKAPMGTYKQALTLKPGANFIEMPVEKLQAGDMNAQILQGSTVVDSLNTRLSVTTNNWLTDKEVVLPLTGNSLPISLPVDAKNVQLSFLSSANAQIARIADDLIDYPYGCVEQTSSRLIPLAMAKQSLTTGVAVPGSTDVLTNLLQQQRLRLVQLAGNDGVFGWWGYASKDNLFLTGYAYYADWYASKALGLNLPADNWSYLFEVYKKHGKDTPLVQRAMVLLWADEMGLPVQNLLQGVDQSIVSLNWSNYAKLAPGGNGFLFYETESQKAYALTLLVSNYLHQKLGVTASPELTQLSAKQLPIVSADRSILLQSFIAMATKNPTSAQSLLGSVSKDLPTIDRSLALIWLQKSLNQLVATLPAMIKPADTGWRLNTSPTGQITWVFQGEKVPAQIALQGTVGSGSQALVRYQTNEVEKSKLPIQVSRKLYELVPESESLSFKVKEVTEGTALSSDALYVDEVVLQPKSGKYHFGLLEVPLPAGASVEGTTWGVKIAGLTGEHADDSSFNRMQFEEGKLSYQVPIETLDKTVISRQLIRFSLKGKFVTPAARYFRMYQPEGKAFDQSGKMQSWLVQ
ncbi:alpha-2-macroglobulin family protein [Leeia sp. TBRC 13508]|uniref:Alpha-2-macroglobulin family protein n=1 Tax=Leeia speluncae TaxID=2884804 RepID=A0ABS8D819_9NEIS|nr:alpha-2-macroglobulin [Leeia speluncae]MCB6184355.1 alpha-2-macroglobulin family protein [Leeia speluncae]